MIAKKLVEAVGVKYLLSRYLKNEKSTKKIHHEHGVFFWQLCRNFNGGDLGLSSPAPITPERS
jgi:hypothetical protein